MFRLINHIISNRYNHRTWLDLLSGWDDEVPIKEKAEAVRGWSLETRPPSHPGLEAGFSSSSTMPKPTRQWRLEL